MIVIVEILGLDLSFLNNFLTGVSPNIYLQAFILLLGFIVLSEIVTFVMENIFVKLAKRTKTDLDDRLIKQTKNPISLLFIFIGIKLAVLHINVQDSLGVFLARVNSVLLIISVNTFDICGLMLFFLSDSDNDIFNSFKISFVFKLTKFVFKKFLNVKLVFSIIFKISFSFDSGQYNLISGITIFR